MTASATNPPTTVVRPTAKSEWTLAGALAAVWVLAMAVALLIAFGAWPDAVAADRITWLGRALIGALLCNGLIVIAFISPFVGTLKVTGPGATLELDGKDDANG